MRGLEIAVGFALICAGTPAFAYCSEPSAPSCATRYGAFDDQDDFDRCKRPDAEQGSVYSRRMVRDKAKAERDRLNGKGGGNPKLTTTVKEGVNPPDKAHIPEARDQKPEKFRSAKAASAYAPKFEEFWAAYPARKGDSERSAGFPFLYEAGGCSNENLTA